MATAARISLEEYMNTSYRPDMEYLDGELREKSMGKIPHGRVQGLLIVRFWLHGEQWHIFAASEVRTQVTPSHVRLPDVVVLPASTEERGALTSPPLVAIEIMSPTDSYNDRRFRAMDLEQMGVKNIWLIDEGARTLEVWRDNAWQLESSTHIQAKNLPVFLDLDWLWQQMDAGR